MPTTGPDIPTPEAVFACMHDRPGAVWLDGVDGWSILACDPVAVAADEARGFLDAGRSMLERGHSGTEPFHSGIMGYVGYEAGNEVDCLPPSRPTPEPRWWWGRYAGALCFHPGHQRWVATGSWNGSARVREWLDQAPELEQPSPAPVPESVQTTPRDVYMQRIRTIQDWIAEGDCYQVNLSRAVHVIGPQDPWEAYRRLRLCSPAEHGAYLRVAEDLAVLCNSPEVLLEVHGREALSRPIKGTRPRRPNAADDRAMMAELRASEKERAELAMIVDLVRNDLGRVATPGSVRTSDRVIRSHAHVHHADWEVRAQLDTGRDSLDALGALFPPGSVVGAPKIRAAQRIAELEDEARGVYCGAVACIDDSGNARANVAIRTAVWTPREVRYHVGGGIVADSDPAAEWEETQHKGRALGRALAGRHTPEDLAK